MIIVIDTNIIISAIIRNSVTRNIVFDKKFNFITPSFALSELSKYKEEICKKAEMSLEDLKS
ncbi:MAG: PIN domain-containing protein [Nanoarchaeota archaeon]